MNSIIEAQQEFDKWKSIVDFYDTEFRKLGEDLINRRGSRKITYLKHPNNAPFLTEREIKDFIAAPLLSHLIEVSPKQGAIRTQHSFD